MSKHKKLAAPIDERLDNVQQDIARMMLLGTGLVGIAAAKDMDYDTVRARAKEVREYWQERTDDVDLFRQELLGWWHWVMRHASLAFEEKPSPAWTRALDSLLKTAMDLVGLRQTVKIQHSPIVHLIQRLGDTQAPVVEGQFAVLPQIEEAKGEE